MSFTFGYQYVDDNPDIIHKHQGLINLEKAISLFESFPWEEQLEKVEIREQNKLSSIYPRVYFYNNRGEYLSIYTNNLDGFIVNYDNNDAYNETYIPNDVTQKPMDVTVERVIELFFKDTLDELLVLYPKNKVLENQDILKFEFGKSKQSLFSPLLFLLIPLFIVILENPSSEKTLNFLIYSELLLLLFLSPLLILNYQYWKNDKKQIVEVDQKNKHIKIVKNNRSILIHRNQVISCDFIHTSPTKRLLREYRYLRIKTSTDTFIITHLTVDPEIVINALSIHYKEEEVFYPNIVRKISSEKQESRIKEGFIKNKKEFLERFSEYENEQLYQIINNPDTYADYAIAAANEILKERKKDKRFR